MKSEELAELFACAAALEEGAELYLPTFESKVYTRLVKQGFFRNKPAKSGKPVLGFELTQKGWVVVRLLGDNAKSLVKVFGEFQLLSDSKASKRST